MSAPKKQRRGQAVKDATAEGGALIEAMTWSRSRRSERQTAALVDQTQAQRPAAGKPIVCEDLPVISEPDDHASTGETG